MRPSAPSLRPGGGGRLSVESPVVFSRHGFGGGGGSSSCSGSACGGGAAVEETEWELLIVSERRFGGGANSAGSRRVERGRATWFDWFLWRDMGK